MKIGVLSLQGGFLEHIQMLHRLGVEAVEVRQKERLNDIEGLIIPGGESTTIGQLARDYKLIAPLRRFALQKPVWGTCAGMIFLAKKIDAKQPLLGIMDIEVKRNAFGRQIESFEKDIDISIINCEETKPFSAIFIRAPKIVTVNGKATVIARLKDGTAVAARERNWLATSFHPELTRDNRFHRYFMGMITASNKGDGISSAFPEGKQLGEKTITSGTFDQSEFLMKSATKKECSDNSQPTGFLQSP